MDKLTQKHSLLSRNMIYPGMFDLPKGLFMLYVFFSHAMILFYPTWEFRHYPIRSARILGLLMDLTVQGTTAMLFISCGYTWRKRKMDKAIRNQASAIAVPYVLTAAAVTMVVIACALYFHTDLKQDLRYSSLPFLLGFCPGREFLGAPIGDIGAMWCVVTYFFGTLLLNLILQEKEIWIHLCLVLLITCTGLLLQEETMVFCFQQILLCTGYMYMGWLMKKTNFFTREMPAYLIALMVIGGMLMGTTGYFEMSQHLMTNGVINWFSALVIGIIYLVVIMQFNQKEGKLLDVLRWMGRESFFLCCVHTFWLLLPEIFVDRMLYPLVSRQVRKPIMVLIMFAFYILTGVGGAFVCKRLKLLFKKRTVRMEV